MLQSSRGIPESNEENVHRGYFDPVPYHIEQLSLPGDATGFEQKQSCSMLCKSLGSP